MEASVAEMYVRASRAGSWTDVLGSEGDAICKAKGKGNPKPYIYIYPCIYI